jgi:hypothetical protein
MRTLRLLAVLSLLAWAITTTAFAQRMGLNFAADEDQSTFTGTLVPGDVAGAVPQANWNNFEFNTGSNSAALVYDNGSGTAVTSTATVSWNGPNTWRSTANNSFTNPGDMIMMTGYIDSNDTNTGRSEVTVDNIDAALRTPAYDVYVYFLGDNNLERGGGYTLTPTGGTPIVKYGSTLGTPTEHVLDPGTDIDNSLDGTYMVFSGLTAPGFTLTGDATLTTPNGFRAPINAVQIVQSLLPGDVNGDGMVNINDFHIIRGNLFKTGQTRAQGDLVVNGTVDFADFREWKRLAPPGVAAGASFGDLAIPEPTSSVLVILGTVLAALAGGRSKRHGGRFSS